MSDAREQALDRFGGRVRVRVGALLLDDPESPSSALLARHSGLWTDGSGSAPDFWTPPGGGVDFGESLHEALRREVREETGLDVAVGPLRYVLDFVRPPLHAVSFYFGCTLTPGASLRALQTGGDPELEGQQLIQDVRMVPFEDLPSLRVYPEGFAERLPADARAGFPDGTVYLGTYR